MNLGKLSGLKGLVSHSQGKRRFRGDLTPEMISPPLGDFRHTMHVGRGGDVFGDTSFLSNHGGTGGNVDADSASNSDKSEGFFSRTLRHMRKTPERPRGGSKDLSPPPPPVSPIIKNAISLPRLDVDSPNGCPVKVLFPSSPKPQEDSCSYGVESGFLTLPRLSRTERQPPANSSVCSLEVCRGSLTDPGLLSTPLNHSDSLSRSDSMTSFTVDLGPSLMSEVFGMIDSPKGQQESSISLDFANDKPELDPITPTLVNSFLREDYNGKRGLYGAGLEEDMAECEHSIRSTADLLLRSLIDEEEGNGVQTVQRAACVQAHPSGSGGLRLSHTSTPPMGNASFAFPEEEEEIKV